MTTRIAYPLTDRMTPTDAAGYLGVALQTLYGWRHRNTGPAGYRVGGKVFYDRADLDEYIEQQKAAERAARSA